MKLNYTIVAAQKNMFVNMQHIHSQFDISLCCYIQVSYKTFSVTYNMYVYKDRIRLLTPSSYKHGRNPSVSKMWQRKNYLSFWNTYHRQSDKLRGFKHNGAPDHSIRNVHQFLDPVRPSEVSSLLQCRATFITYGLFWKPPKSAQAANQLLNLNDLFF